MVVIKNVALIGATGALGEPVLDAIVKSGKFSVTVLARSASKAAFPSSVKVATVDYSDVASLTEAFRGNDAVVSTVGTPGLQGQTIAIDAAIAAGVKRFLPSEFGSDLGNPKTAALPIFGYKVHVNKYLEEKVAANPDFAYTLIRNGAFLDWGLDMNFLLDMKSGKPAIYDGGDQLFSTTTLKSVGQAVVGVLTHPDETKNRAVYVQDMLISQNKLLTIANKIAPEKTKSWEPVPKSLAAIKKASDEALAKGQHSIEVMVPYIFVSLFGEGYGGRMEKTDNDLLGVAGDKTDADVEGIMTPLLK
ncbi:Oxidoreductase BOA1 [Hyphodiscus hymeniophilus]|uniref:Oxidoreductase BOA1 n=1 Tax=Hyphodiscus hymeniophilus TaxID=353542 RepID=A0A9P7AU35_9HELO|nr:Oxidoreductase BOA1 [Hyphodiscus hymeniophilus]